MPIAANGHIQQKKQKLGTRLMGLTSLLMLTACTTPMAIGGIDPTKQTASLSALTDVDVEPQAISCLLFDPILWSVDDTAPTILQIKQHNRKLSLYCETSDE